jgi:cellulose synthase/poly-beta-1,6-N-acetylglucosamine synthase-like glycosyltransferase
VTAPIATFVIPCCNGAAHVGATIASILAQDRQDFDLVLVDDASTDDSVAVATAAGGSRLLVERHAQRLGERHPPHLGQPHCIHHCGRQPLDNAQRHWLS